MEQLPVPVRKFTGESRVVDVNRVFDWLQRGWLLFMAEPAQWLLMTLVLIAFVLSIILFVPVMMAMWFAPALVFFEDASPIDAIKASFSACWKNIVPFIVYGLLMFIASIVAALPFMLGFLVLLPIIFGSMLASYKDIFASQS